MSDPDAASRFPCTVLPGGWHFDAAGDTPLLQSAARAGIALASSCRNGTCRTCISHVQSGEVHYLIEWPGLSAEEKRDGWILPCVAHPRSALVFETPFATRASEPPP